MISAPEPGAVTTSTSWLWEGEGGGCVVGGARVGLREADSRRFFRHAWGTEETSAGVREKGSRSSAAASNCLAAGRRLENGGCAASRQAARAAAITPAAAFRLVRPCCRPATPSTSVSVSTTLDQDWLQGRSMSMQRPIVDPTPTLRGAAATPIKKNATPPLAACDGSPPHLGVAQDRVVEQDAEEHGAERRDLAPGERVVAHEELLGGLGGARVARRGLRHGLLARGQLGRGRQEALGRDNRRLLHLSRWGRGGEAIGGRRERGEKEGAHNSTPPLPAAARHSSSSPPTHNPPMAEDRPDASPGPHLLRGGAQRHRLERRDRPGRRAGGRLGLHAHRTLCDHSGHGGGVGGCAANDAGGARFTASGEAY